MAKVTKDGWYSEQVVPRKGRSFTPWFTRLYTPPTPLMCGVYRWVAYKPTDKAYYIVPWRSVFECEAIGPYKLLADAKVAFCMLTEM